MKPADAKATVVAYHKIKAGILDLRYPPGGKLSETRLSAELGLGRSPIRSALARLKEEGWIEIAPQSGTYVRALSAQDVDNVLELRLILETHVAGAASCRMTAAAVRRLREALVALRPAILAGDIDRFRELDEQVHAAIYEAAGNGLIAQLLHGLREKVRWVLPVSADPRQRAHAVDELESIIRALEMRDPAAAARHMREHISDSAEKRGRIGNRPVMLTRGDKPAAGRGPGRAGRLAAGPAGVAGE